MPKINSPVISSATMNVYSTMYLCVAALLLVTVMVVQDYIVHPVSSFHNCSPSQMGFPLHLIVDDKCDLISESGKMASSEMDKRVDDHFNSCLDRLADWRSTEGEDCSLEGPLSCTWTRALVHTHVHVPA